MGGHVGAGLSPAFVIGTKEATFVADASVFHTSSRGAAAERGAGRGPHAALGQNTLVLQGHGGKGRAGFAFFFASGFGGIQLAILSVPRLCWAARRAGLVVTALGECSTCSAIPNAAEGGRGGVAVFLGFKISADSLVVDAFVVLPDAVLIQKTSGGLGLGLALLEHAGRA